MNKALLSLSSIFALAACSVETGRVKHSPPEIADRVTATLNTSEYGRVVFDHPQDMDGISMFLWPQTAEPFEVSEACRLSSPHADERLAGERVCEVNKHSKRVDAIFGELAREIGYLNRRFAWARCAAFANEQDATVGQEVMTWKTLELGDSRQATLKDCQGLHERYLSSTEKGFAEIASHKEAIIGLVGSENWIEINKKLSSISVVPSKNAVDVTITLRIGKVTFSTLTEKVGGKEAQLIREASYDPRYRLLKFKMNELDTDRQPTGSVYQFSLERIQVNGLARWTGDLRLTKDGKTLRYGSAQISGRIEPLNSAP